jgi:hypothetical protein
MLDDLYNCRLPCHEMSSDSKATSVFLGFPEHFVFRDEIDGTCSAHVDMRNAYNNLFWKPKGKRPPGRHRCIWENNVKMDLTVTVRPTVTRWYRTRRPIHSDHF